MLLLWVVLSAVIGNKWLLPSPAETIEALGRLAATADFYLAIAGSLLSVIGGFAAGNLVGFVIGAASGLSRRVHAFVRPGMTIIKTVPVASFIFLILLWVGRSFTPALTSFLIVLPVVWQNVVAGIRSADKKQLEMAKVFRLSPFKKMKYIYLPAVAEGYVAAVRTSMGLAWKAGVAAEVLSITVRTLGGGIYNAKNNIETPELFAYTVVIIIISLLAEAGAAAIMRIRADRKKKIAERSVPEDEKQ